jgi:hypothetical protein
VANSVRVKRAVVGVACAAFFVGGAIVAAGGPSGGSPPVSYKVVTKDVVVPTAQIERINVTCPAGMVPTGGGGHFGVGSWPRSSTATAYVSESSIDPAGNGWETTVVVEDGQGASSFTVSAVCARF